MIRPESYHLVCPSCRKRALWKETHWQCPEEGFLFPLAEGIPDFLLPDRRPVVDEFLFHYHTVRDHEGWGSPKTSYYLELPFRDLGGTHRGIWRIRAETYRRFVEELEQEFDSRPLSFLDLGAGNCWLSLRLLERRFEGIAVDVSLSTSDGLRVPARVFGGQPEKLLCIRAEFDFLPFPNGHFDLILFNASLHYSRDPYETVLKALPLLKGNGAMYILDSPMYTDSSSGDEMLKERREDFRKRYQISLPSSFVGNFLTPEFIDRLRQRHEVELLSPRYGLRWRVRSRILPLFLKREPASFFIVKVRPSLSNV